MKVNPRSRTISILWRVSVCAWICVGVYWFYLTYISRFSPEDVRDEGERVVAALEQYNSTRGKYPRRLEDTRVADQKFPIGVSFAYTPNDTFHDYILVVSGGGHTWRYRTALHEWQYVPPGAGQTAAPAE
jgi:hypothetical protein